MDPQKRTEIVFDIAKNAPEIANQIVIALDEHCERHVEQIHRLYDQVRAQIPESIRNMKVKDLLAKGIRMEDFIASNKENEHARPNMQPERLFDKLVQHDSKYELNHQPSSKMAEERSISSQRSVQTYNSQHLKGGHRIQSKSPLKNTPTKSIFKPKHGMDSSSKKNRSNQKQGSRWK